MKPVITLAFAFSISAGNAQTPLIAHKSHAGSSATYFIAPSSNFGELRIDLDKSFQQPKLYRAENFRPLNDSVIILETMDIDQKVISTDTFPNKEKYSPIIFQARYTDSIRKKEWEENDKRETEQKEQLIKEQQESIEQINEPAPAKKKKKSYLLFLFGITGGGMLLMKLFGRSTKQSIATV
jgi:hypothetical protein